MAIGTYERWRQKQIDDPKAAYPPSQHDIQERLGSWATAVQVTDAALKDAEPLRARHVGYARAEDPKMSCETAADVIRAILPRIQEDTLCDLRDLIAQSVATPASSELPDRHLGYSASWPHVRLRASRSQKSMKSSASSESSTGGLA